MAYYRVLTRYIAAETEPTKKLE